MKTTLAIRGLSQNGKGLVSKYSIWLVLILFANPARGDSMDIYRVASGFGVFNTAVWLKSFLYAVIAVYLCWVIAAGLWSWVQGNITVLALFFIVCRSSLLVVIASYVVGVVS